MFSKALSLRFVDTSLYNHPQTYDNRLLQDLVFYNVENVPYRQPYLRSDRLYFQFNTIVPNQTFDVKIVALCGSEWTYPLTPTLVYTSDDNREFYDVSIGFDNMPMPVGSYAIYVKSDADAYPYISEPFEIFDSEEQLPNTVMIKWFGVNRGYLDGIYWKNSNVYLRVRGEVNKASTDQIKKTYRDSMQRPITLDAKPIEKYILNIDAAPYYIMERINAGLNHDVFTVNDVEYNSESAVTVKQFSRSLLYSATAELEVLLPDVRALPNTELYYRLDGSNPITAPFAGGGQRIRDIANGVNDTDAATVAQLNGKTFISLTDTPTDYTGHAGHKLVVNTAESAVEFIEDDPSTIYHNYLAGRNAADAHPIEAITDLENTLNAKADAANVFNKNEFIDATSGAADSGKPIVLGLDGKLDPDMTYDNIVYLVGGHDPSGSAEYPDLTGETEGASYLINVIANPNAGDDWTFQTGDLQGDTVKVGDYIIWNGTAWIIHHSVFNPNAYVQKSGDVMNGGLIIQEEVYNLTLQTTSPIADNPAANRPSMVLKDSNGQNVYYVGTAGTSPTTNVIDNYLRNFNIITAGKASINDAEIWTKDNAPNAGNIIGSRFPIEASGWIPLITVANEYPVGKYTLIVGRDDQADANWATIVFEVANDGTFRVTEVKTISDVIVGIGYKTNGADSDIYVKVNHSTNYNISFDFAPLHKTYAYELHSATVPDPNIVMDGEYTFVTGISFDNGIRLTNAVDEPYLDVINHNNSGFRLSIPVINDGQEVNFIRRNDIDNGIRFAIFSTEAPANSLVLNPDGTLTFTASVDSVKDIINTLKGITDKVGIDYANPTHKLEVGGSIKAHGNIVSTTKVKAHDFVLINSGAPNDSLRDKINDLEARVAALEAIVNP